MKIAYIITAYQDHKQLNRLVCSLDPDSDFFIHIDKKVNIKPFIEELDLNKNVFFTKRRFFINWGSFAQVLAIKELLRSIFEGGKLYDRVVCLSGMDYPIRSNRMISNEFSLNKSKQYIMGFNLSQSKIKKQLAKVTVYHFFRDINISNSKIKRILSGTSRYIFELLPIRKKRKVFLYEKMNDIYGF